MSQNTVTIPTSGTLSGAALVAGINAAFDTLATNFLGAAAPSLPKGGQFWINNAVPALWPVQIYDGAQWISLGSIDTANNTFVHSVANGTLAAPGLYFASDVTTGIYRPGAGVVGLVSGGALAASFGTSYSTIVGNLSVGTGSNAVLASARGIHVGGGASAELHLTTTASGATAASGLLLALGSDNVARLTAPSLAISAPTEITASSSAASLTVTQSGTGSSFVVNDQSGDASPFLIDDSGTVICGSTTALPSGFTGGGLLLIGDGTSRNLSMARAEDGTGGCAIFAHKARGSLTAPSAVQSGDTLLVFQARGHDGIIPVSSSQILFSVDGNVSANSVPSRITFSTTAVGSTTMSEALRITSDNSLVHRGNATTIVDTNSHLGLRSYTVATLPAASATKMIYVSNGTANKRLAVSDGTSWRWPDGNIVS